MKKFGLGSRPSNNQLRRICRAGLYAAITAVHNHVDSSNPGRPPWWTVCRTNDVAEVLDGQDWLGGPYAAFAYIFSTRPEAEKFMCKCQQDEAASLKANGNS